jgi:diguanylate cyclase (GGDEF)-like protein
MTDALTGLRTHRDGLRDAIVAHGSACCLVDVDALIWVNDQYGHVEGDRVLSRLAEYFTLSLADRAAAVFRVGGDEFLVLLPPLDSIAACEVAAGIVTGVRALQIPYRRIDRPHRAILEVNAAVLRASSAFADQAFSEFGITHSARDWVGEHIFREKTRLSRDAGIVLDLSDAVDCPWAG